MAQYTSEITSLDIASDNPIHQRQVFAYEHAKQYIKGRLLEVGPGNGRGFEYLMPHCDHYTAIDKNDELMAQHAKNYPDYKFINAFMPPFKDTEDNSFDCVVVFQVIEHIGPHKEFVKEIYRVLKPGGVAVITTPNKKRRLARNPWHVREYTGQELMNILKTSFNDVEIKSITGNQKVWDYYEKNKKAVQKYTRFDIFGLQYIIPPVLWRGFYDKLNRQNREHLMDKNTDLTNEILLEDHFFVEDLDEGFDHFAICRK